MISPSTPCVPRPLSLCISCSSRGQCLALVSLHQVYYSPSKSAPRPPPPQSLPGRQRDPFVGPLRGSELKARAPPPFYMFQCLAPPSEHRCSVHVQLVSSSTFAEEVLESKPWAASWTNHLPAVSSWVFEPRMPQFPWRKHHNSCLMVCL